MVQFSIVSEYFVGIDRGFPPNSSHQNRLSDDPCDDLTDFSVIDLFNVRLNTSFYKKLHLVS